jgi:hypothetical protein
MGPLSEAELQAGLVAGAAAALLIGSVLLLRQRVSPPGAAREPWPYGGMVGVVAALVVVRAIGPLPWELVAATIGITAAIDLIVVSGRSWWYGALAALPFACFLATTEGLPEVLWFQGLVVAGVVGGAVLTAVSDGDWRAEAAAPVLYAVSVAGVYAAVPDTEHPLGLLGVALWLAVLAWPWPLVRFGAGGAAGMATLFVWTAADGARGRPASFIGALACFGLLAVLPLGVRLGRGLPDVLSGLGDRARVVVLGVVQVAVVLLAARTSGLQSSIPSAVALAVPPLAVAYAAASVLRPHRPEEPEPPYVVAPLRRSASDDA